MHNIFITIYKTNYICLKCSFLGRRYFYLTPYGTYCLWLNSECILPQDKSLVNTLINYSATAVEPTLLGLIRTPGPIVDATAQDLIY